MLELVTRRKPYKRNSYIVHEVKMAIDPSDLDHYGLQGLLDQEIHGAASTAGFRQFVQLALRCVDESAELRPTMLEVVKEIKVVLQSNDQDQLLASSSVNKLPV
ncbi:hypothetical protein PR202_gb01613 [Eleusine coracana subsp. coracana]|uniref:Uncharacterized protein n=1 Tax=Eleusine coracana subsp. coracana TaxID=191504 RepID=A0AAV5DWZ0_ELECO|nr:hypothetical protein PR202_gb01613 [Eleusine coracana subsp. coracana]